MRYFLKSKQQHVFNFFNKSVSSYSHTTKEIFVFEFFNFGHE